MIWREFGGPELNRTCILLSLQIPHSLRTTACLLWYELLYRVCTSVRYLKPNNSMMRNAEHLEARIFLLGNQL
jgi:hypothetical protein